MNKSLENHAGSVNTYQEREPVQLEYAPKPRKSFLRRHALLLTLLPLTILTAGYVTCRVIEYLTFDLSGIVYPGGNP